MNEKVKAFYEAVSADGTLQEELVAVTNGIDLGNFSEEEARQAMAEATAEFAAAHDLDLAAADVIEAYEVLPDGELSEEELADVSGGISDDISTWGEVDWLLYYMDVAHRWKESKQQQQQ